MLGKGLESLIPKGGQQGGQGGPKPQSSGEEQRPAAQPTVPVSQAPMQPAASHHPGFVPAVPQVVRVQPATPSPASAHPSAPVQGASIFQIELDRIVPNPDQPRRHFDEEALHELANSIREFGLLQPIVVSQTKKETANGVEVEYQIIAGERRYLAAKMLGLPRVPAVVRNVSLEREKLELGVIENIQRENLNPIEMARAFQRLQEEFRMTQREIAAKLGKSREVVANAVRLLDLPEYVQKAVESGEVSESNARMLIAVGDPAAQRALLDDIVKNKLTTRDVRMKVDAAAAASNPGVPGVRRRGRPPREETRLAPEVKALQDELRAALGAPVEITKGATNGKITITFFSEEELKNILEKLRRENEEGRF